MRLSLVLFSVCLGLVPLAVFGNLALEANTEKELSGIFYHDNITGDADVELMFSSIVEGDEIVSVTKVYIPLLNVSTVPLITLRIPLELKDERVVDGLLPMVLKAGTLAAQTVKEETNSSVMLVDVAEMYHEFVAELYAALIEEDAELNQLQYSLMYHASVMSAANQVSMGATDPDDICLVSPKYVYGTQYFLCMQDLEFIARQFEFLDEPMPPQSDLPLKEEPYLRYPDDLKEEGESKVLPDRGISYYPQRKGPVFLERGVEPKGLFTAKFWGCCMSRGRRCTQFSEDCYTLDCMCQCCDKYFCGEECTNTRGIGCDDADQQMRPQDGFQRLPLRPRQQCF